MKVLMKLFTLNLFWYLLFSNTLVFAETGLPKLFLYLADKNASEYKNALENPYVTGAQIVYSWRALEPKQGKYDFSKINKDLAFLTHMHKKLFIQLQDRSFQPDIFNVPDYIRKEPIYHGGEAMQLDKPNESKSLVIGWVARTWDPAVRNHFHLLMEKLAAQYDGKVYGINLPETAVDFNNKNLPVDFTFSQYFLGELDNMAVLRRAFHHSIVVQYVNFFPNEWNNDHNYMNRFFAFALQHHIGLGGPDTVPYIKAQMKNSYPFFHQYKGKIFSTIAIQKADYTYTNPKTGHKFKFMDFYTFTQNYLGAQILFWNVQEPFFSKELIPKLEGHYFEHSV